MISPEVFSEQKAVFLVCDGCNCPLEPARPRQAASSRLVSPQIPLTLSEKGLYGFISGAVVKAAEKMPEENYSFKPTPEVRSFGQLVGHVERRRQLHVLLTGLGGSESDEGYRDRMALSRAIKSSSVWR